jgi:CheY-like chemotaxis protein
VKDRFLIVIADDDLDDQELMRGGLKDCKVKVEISAVYNGLQLLDFLLKRGPYKNIIGLPDLIMLDLNMPLMDGFEVLKEIRSHDSFKSIPIYVITTSRRKEDKEMAMILGANGFYHKGSSSKDIRSIVFDICQECFEPNFSKRKVLTDNQNSLSNGLTRDC